MPIVFGDATPSVPSFIGSKVILRWIACVHSRGKISRQICINFSLDVYHIPLSNWPRPDVTSDDRLGRTVDEQWTTFLHNNKIIII